MTGNELLSGIDAICSAITEALPENSYAAASAFMPDEPQSIDEVTTHESVSRYYLQQPAAKSAVQISGMFELDALRRPRTLSGEVSV